MDSEYSNKKINRSNFSSLNPTKLNDSIFSKFSSKKFNGARKLILNGNDLFSRIGRRIEDDDIYNLTAFLKKNSDINSLSLAYNSIHCRGFIRLINYLTTNNEIIELNVQSNEIGSEGIKNLCSKASKLKLKILRLNGNKLAADVCKEVADTLLQSSINQLDVAEIDMKTSSLLNFISALRSSSLKIIHLSRPIPEFHSHLDSQYLATIIGSMLKINTSLTELHLQKYNFSCHDIESMLIDAKFNKTLQLIDLGCNNIGDHGVESICDWIRGSPALAGLNLSHNIITDIGARALSFALPFSKVISLDISYNKIKDNGIRDILWTIKKSIPICHLRIYGNKIESSAHHYKVKRAYKFLNAFLEFGTLLIKNTNKIFDENNNLFLKLKIIERMLNSGALVQDSLDIKPYKVDGKFYAAHYPADNFKQRYYNISRYGVPRSNLYSESPKIFACIDASAFKPKQTRKTLSCNQDSTENIEDKESNSSNIDSFLESLESQSEKNYCYCAPEETSSSESSTDWFKIKDSKMQSVMLILDKVDYGLKNYILKWINAADAPPENFFDYLH